MDRMRSSSQLYIGVPTGVVLCIDAVMEDGAIYAGIWHAYRQEALRIDMTEKILAEMERLFDEIGYPQSTTAMRSFDDGRRAGHSHAVISAGADRDPVSKELRRIHSDDELLRKAGSLATFIIRVQHRHNSEWQGRITWEEHDRTESFTTVSQMLRLIESAIRTASEEDV